MDATAYKYLIEKLQQETDARRDARSDFPPLFFAKSPVDPSPEAFRSLEFFLGNVADRGKPGHGTLHWFLSCEGSFFQYLFLSAHLAIADVLSGESASSHVFRTNGIQLVRFLEFCAPCARGDRPLFFPQPHPVDCAMLCFLSEAMMHAGWCPSAFEGEAKRAAHSYFIGLKKSLHRAGPGDIAIVCCYLWGAWLLARKTEGIRTGNCHEVPGECETFSWKTETATTTYIARKSAEPELFYVLCKSQSSIPHPFVHLMNDGRAGLDLRINNEDIRPVSLADFVEIKRRKMPGHRFIYNCASGLITDIEWTIAVLAYESTVYRIDILKFPEGTEGTKKTDPLPLTIEMRLESTAKPGPSGANSFLARGPKNTVVRFCECPFTFAYDRQEENGIAVFTASGLHEKGPLKIITAWAEGKGISAINETKLLGIYE